MSRVDAVVVGSGPYGLSVAAHLNAGGLRSRVFGDPMETWRRQMPTGMLLKSEGFASNLSDPGGELTLERFCAEEGRAYAPVGLPVPVEVFVAYGNWFAARAGVEPEADRIAAIHRRVDGFAIEPARGPSLEARTAVVATGISRFGYVPEELAGLGDRCVHSSAYGPLHDLAGRSVVVVGGGQSAIECAALLHEAGSHPVVAMRRASVVWNGRPEPLGRPLAARIRWPLSPLGGGLRLWASWRLSPAFRALPLATRDRLVRETLGPAGAWWLRERIEGRVPILVGHRLERAVVVPDGVRLSFASPAGVHEVAAERIIAATGYRVDLDRLEFLTPAIRGALRTDLGYPRVSGSFESSVRGLYFAGVPAAIDFGPLMRFVCGAELAAGRIAAHVGAAARLGFRRRRDGRPPVARAMGPRDLDLTRD
jgi:FAD-dependent urate hydroxylase